MEAQLRLAVKGVVQPVEQRQTASGIKDTIAQFWIEKLYIRGRDLRYQKLTNPETRDSRLNNRSLKGSALEAVKKEILDEIECDQ